RRRARDAPDLHPPRPRLEATDRSARPDLDPLRRRDRRGDTRRLPETEEGDRGRRTPRPHRGPVVAVLPHRAQPGRALSAEPAPDRTGPGRRHGGDRGRLAGTRTTISRDLEG